MKTSKKLISIAVAAAITLAGCGSPAVITTVDGKAKEYPTYGWFNWNTSMSEKVCYDVSVGNVVWSIILIETVIAPVYFIGFSLFNPIGPKIDGKCGIDV